MLAALFDINVVYTILGIVFLMFVFYLFITKPEAKTAIITIALVVFIVATAYCGIQLNNYYTAKGGVWGYITGLINNNTTEITITDNIEFNLKNIVLTQEKDDTYSATILKNDIIQFKENVNYGVYVNGDPCYQVDYATNYIRAEYGYTFMDDNLESKLTDTLQFNFAFFDKSSQLKITTVGGQNAVNYWNNYFARNKFIVKVKQSHYDKDDNLSFGEGDISEYKELKFLIKGEENSKKVVKVGEKISLPQWSNNTEYVAYWTLNGKRVDFNNFVVEDNCIFEAVIVPIEQHSINLIYSTDEKTQNLIKAGSISVEEDDLYITKTGNGTPDVLVICQNGLSFDVRIRILPEFIMNNDYEIIVISDNDSFKNSIQKRYLNDSNIVTTGYAYEGLISFKEPPASATVIFKVIPREFKLSIRYDGEEVLNVPGLVYGRKFNLVDKLTEEQISLVKNSVGSNKIFKGIYTKQIMQGIQYYDENLLFCEPMWLESMYEFNHTNFVDNPSYDKQTNSFHLYIGFIYRK